MRFSIGVFCIPDKVLELLSGIINREPVDVLMLSLQYYEEIYIIRIHIIVVYR